VDIRDTDDERRDGVMQAAFAEAKEIAARRKCGLHTETVFSYPAATSDTKVRRPAAPVRRNEAVAFSGRQRSYWRGTRAACTPRRCSPTPPPTQRCSAGALQCITFKTKYSVPVDIKGKVLSPSRRQVIFCISTVVRSWSSECCADAIEPAMI